MSSVSETFSFSVVVPYDSDFPAIRRKYEIANNLKIRRRWNEPEYNATIQNVIVKEGKPTTLIVTCKVESHIEVGDTVTRYFCDKKMRLQITQIDDDYIYCSEWKFCKKTGAEVDEELGWGPPPNLTGSYIDLKGIRK